MSRPVVPTCDGCGRQKQQSNAWWTVDASPEDGGLLTIHRGTVEAIGSTLGLHDFCGVDCALKFISEQMGKQAQS
jgi:hypothetical protein